MAGLTTVASWSSPGEGERLWFLGTLATIKIPGEATGERFALIEFLFPHGASPPLHTHPQDESYIVLNGRLTVVSGEQRFELEPGAGRPLEVSGPQAVGRLPLGGSVTTARRP